MKKLITIISVAILIGGCAEYAKWSSNNNSAEYDDWKLKHSLQEQLDHERLVRDCQLYNSCKGSYKIYNSDPKKR